MFEKLKGAVTDAVSTVKEKAESVDIGGLVQTAKEKAMNAAGDVTEAVGNVYETGKRFATTIKSKFVIDIDALHLKMGHQAAADALSNEKSLAYLELRIRMMEEEVREIRTAFEERNPDKLVDAFTDCNVVSIGTLQLFHVNTDKAWDVVQAANMAKNPGVNPNRPNEYGLPDMIKPEGWTAPSHADNLGRLADILK